MYQKILKTILTTSAIYFLVMVFIANAGEIVVKRQSPVRSEPRGSSKKIGVADEGERYTLITDAPTNKWYQIEFQGQPGWIYYRWISIENTNPASTVKIATFNTLRLGQRKDKMIGVVAAILIRYDVVALEEVMYDTALPELIDSLKSATLQKDGVNIEWAYIASEAVGRTTYKEHYAFVWRKDRVQEKSGSEYVFNDVNDKFDREPFVADFKSGNFDFTLIAMHSTFGNSKTPRQEEATALADVYNDVQAKDSKENDIILMGDFNLPSDDNGWNDMKSINGMTWVLNPPAKSTIATAGMGNLYDNIWFQSQYLTEYSGEGGTYEFMHDYFEDDPYAEARTSVSDHVPVYAIFKTDMPDDD